MSSNRSENNHTTVYRSSTEERRTSFFLKIFVAYFTRPPYSTVPPDSSMASYSIQYCMWGLSVQIVYPGTVRGGARRIPHCRLLSCFFSVSWAHNGSTRRRLSCATLLKVTVALLWHLYPGSVLPVPLRENSSPASRVPGTGSCTRTVPGYVPGYVQSVQYGAVHDL
jgi:hypothetical protein